MNHEISSLPVACLNSPVDSLSLRVKAQTLLIAHKVLYKNLIYNYLPLCSLHSRHTCLLAIPQHSGNDLTSELTCWASTFTSFKSFFKCHLLSECSWIINLTLLITLPCYLFLWNLSPRLYNILIYYVRVWFHWMEYKFYERRYFVSFVPCCIWWMNE